MAKSMYQKREERKQKKLNSGENSGVNKIDINWYPGHMAKTKREIKEKIDLIDIVYEVIDSRMPISSKIIDIKEVTKDKPTILIMTKYDMCDKLETNKFIDYYKEEGYTVIPVDLLNNINVDNIINESNKLLVEMNERRKQKGMKPRNIRALIIGVPNVGKSTLINRMVGKKATQTGNKPGVTKKIDWIRINKNIDLLDTPGILWPKLENQEHAKNLASLSSIKEEILDLEELSIYILNKMISFYPNMLKERYGVNDFSDIYQIIDQIGKKRGALLKGGAIDYEKVYTIIINDLRDGLLGKITFDRY